MTTYRKTPAAARELGIPYTRLVNWLRSGRLAPPGRDTSGDYVWTDDDMAPHKAGAVCLAVRPTRGRARPCCVTTPSPALDSKPLPTASNSSRPQAEAHRREVRVPALLRWARQVRDHARQRTLPLPPLGDQVGDQAAQATVEQKAG